MAFAKLFDSVKYGQLLAKMDRNEETGAPELRWYAEPPGLGACSFALGFSDDDDGWDKAKAAFEHATLAEAEKAASVLFQAAGIDAY
jgi:hypothetical protein